jgi:putative hydrolase of the HAD superfamily
MFDLIAFDADDTLWHNESVFQATEGRFVEMLRAYHSEEWIRERLFQTEVKNLSHFGYGVKGFILSMIETAIELSEGQVRGREVQEIIAWGHEMLRMPIELLDGVQETVAALACDHRLMLVTKGDLFDQEAKLARSGLGELFSAVEIVSRKDAKTYERIIARHGVTPAQFLMIGNSLRSDVLPAVEAGAAAIHIPYVTTWAHENVSEDELAGKEIVRLDSIREVTAWLQRVPRAR